MGDYRSLIVYQKAFSLAMKIYHISKKFPLEEKFGLIAQIRNSSRSVCVNLVEAYKRRRYRDYFLSKLNDSETENGETQVWLDFSIECGYVTKDEYNELKFENDEVAKLLLYMINNPDKFR
jgi:four helix bundle protein